MTTVTRTVPRMTMVISLPAIRDQPNAMHYNNRHKPQAIGAP